jgi:hypothetical protein
MGVWRGRPPRAHRRTRHRSGKPRHSQRVLCQAPCSTRRQPTVAFADTQIHADHEPPSCSAARRGPDLALIPSFHLNTTPNSRRVPFGRFRAMPVGQPLHRLAHSYPQGRPCPQVPARRGRRRHRMGSAARHPRSAAADRADSVIVLYRADRSGMARWQRTRKGSCYGRPGRRCLQR